MDIMTILTISIFASIMIGVVLLLKRVFKTKLDVRVVSVLWMLVLIRLCVPALIESPLHLDMLIPSDTQAIEERETLPVSNNTSMFEMDIASGSYEPNSSVAANGTNTTTTAQETQSVPAAAETPGFLVTVGVWQLVWMIRIIGGSVVLLVSVGKSVFFWRNTKKHSELMEDTVIREIVAAHKKMCNIRRSISVFTCSCISMPMLIGVIRPKILLPLNMPDELRDKHISTILLHEICHIKRNDILKNYACIIGKSLHWFNPLVWIGLKQMKQDMEFSCDQLVLALMDTECGIDYCESLLYATRFMKEKNMPQLAVHFCESKAGLKERVHRMVKPQKKSRSSVIIALLLAVIMMLACFTTACQPTPEEAVVINKNEDLIETVLEANTEENLPELEEDKQVIQEQIKQVNGHMELEIVPNDMVTIRVDADIIAPDLQKIPMVRIRPLNFTQQKFETFMDIVTDGHPVYYEEFPDNGTNLSKEEIIALLSELKRYEKNDELPDHIRDHLESRISDLERDLSNAVSRADEQQYDGTLTPVENNGTYSHITSLKCYMDKEMAARVSCWQSFNGTSTSLQFFNEQYGAIYNTYEPYEGVDAQHMDMTYEEAKAMAEELVRKVDGDDTNMMMFDSRICYSVGSFADYTKETSPQAYSFNFARQYSGVEIKPVMWLFSHDGLVDYSKQIMPESITITIDDNGYNLICWKNYTEFIEMVAEDAPLMEFDEIQKIFEQQCRHEFAWVPQNDALLEQPSVTLNVKRIELNLMVIPEKDNLENYITVPVWDFIADEDFDWEVMSQDGYPGEGQKNCSIMTINAINGSIIDREQGF